MAVTDNTTPAPASDGALAILNPLSRAELERILRIGGMVEGLLFRLEALTGETSGKCLPALSGHLIDGLLTFLDSLDGDPDLEEGGDDEPCIAGSHTDLEGDDADGEPSLGSPERFPRREGWGFIINDPTSSQAGWGSGSRSDREDEHDGSEPDADAEPSLGIANVLLGVVIPESRALWRAEVRDPGIDQTAWASGGDDDREGGDEEIEGEDDEDREPEDGF